ncbi:MAG TPA: DUF1800 family protein, partial [Chthoniobacteraceae bacterium]|nr:DUF1800 family protein [Chthoniobacteraceae bacterium]
MTLIPLTTLPANLWRRFASFGMLLAALLSLEWTASAAIDEAINKGVWKLLYRASDAQVNSPSWLAGDDDGDAMSNQAELDAGTDPFNRNSSLKVTSLNADLANVSLTFPTLAKKLYVVQACVVIAPANWANVAPTVQAIGDGNNKTLVVPKSSGVFFRVVVQDLDADNDGVSDWAEQVVGLDSASAISNGQVDVNGLPVSDGAFVYSQFAVQGRISIGAINSSATQPATSLQPAPAVGKIGITRLGFSRFLPAAEVSLSVGGTAAAGVDYQALPTSSGFQANEVSKEILITPLYNANRRESISVVITLAASPNYTISGQGWAAVIINPTSAPGGTGLLARYYDTAASVYADAANFGQAGTYNFTRNASPTTTGSIVVSYSTGNFSALQVGHGVKLTFTSGNLNNALYNHQVYPVTSVTGSSFTVGINATAALPASGTGNCSFSVQSFLHPPVVERIDSVVNFDYQYGTPNGVVILPTNSPDNYSAVWDAYLHPTTAGAYMFQLDADDKARVLLDLNDGNGLQQILEHGWDGPATVGTFKQSAAYNLTVPATPASRYRIRVEHVETTGDARCRLQWRLGAGAYANIPQTNTFTHTQAATYAFTRASSTNGTATITLTNHGLITGDTVTLAFSASNLFTPTSYSGAFAVANATANTFDVAIVGTNLPANVGAGQGCFLEGRVTSTTTGVFNRCYANTTMSGSPGRVGIDAAITVNNNGIWGAGTPAADLIAPETFSARWTGQVQPQFTEDYTFIVHADDGCALWINGQPQALKTSPSTITGGSTYSYNGTTGDAVVTYSGLAVIPGSFSVGETVRIDPTSGNLNHGASASYSYDGATGETVVTYSALTNIAPGGFVVGETVQLDPTSGNLNALGTTGYIITAATPTTFTVNFGTGTFTTGTGSMTIGDTRDAVVTAASATTFTLNLGTGKYAAGTGNISVEIVNKTLKDWASMGNERYVRIPMRGGVRYDIQLDLYENTGYARCQLSWYSPSQPKQIVPANRLYPANLPLAGSDVTSSDSASGVVGGTFTHTISGSNGGTVSITGNPSWLTLNGNVLGGTPPPGAGGDYQILITITNANGTGTSVLNLHVDENSAIVTRESWTGVTGNGVAAIPVNAPPNGADNLTSLQAPSDFDDNYGARIRGYITAPATGNYYFWLAASDAAELWISNDSEPVNKLKRATVTAGSTTPLDWAAARKSPWLALEGGQKYYFEILHKAGAGTGDNLAVGWLKPGQSGSTPSEVVPAPVLSPYYDTPALANPGTLYVATMLSQGGANTSGVGSSTLRLNADETIATMRYSYSGLTGPLTSQHIHSDPYLGNPSTILFDIDDPATSGDGLQPDGSYKWTIASVGTLSAADIREIIKQGKAYINLHTAAYPSGEIRGNYTLAVGSRTFTPPPAPPSWADDHATDAGAVRFLSQATFGPNIADIVALKQMPSYEAWIEDQFSKPATIQLPEVRARELSDANGGSQFDESLTFNAWWRNSMTGQDQLRQRVAFALSQIHVVSSVGPLDNRGDALSYFYDKLATNAFGNFRDILVDTTLTPTMGRYLDMLRNDKPDLSVGRIPNENYAREIKQLFSIGLYRLWPDGSLILNSKDAPIDTYTQREIVGFSHVFTGWDYGYNGTLRTALNAPVNWTRQMREVPARHFTGPKRILNNEVMPGLPSIGGQPLDPYATHSSSYFSDAAYQSLPSQELDAAHDQLFHHPNVGPFICRQLIQRLVTSHPSRDYLYRVVQSFNDNGSGERGDMKAVIKAILLDYEARSGSEATKPDFGKQREPLLRYAAAARAFRQNSASGTYSQSGSHVMNITMPNKLAGGNNVFLEFPRPEPFTAGDTAPTTQSYTVLSTPAPTPTTFSVIAKGWTGVSTSNGSTNGGATGTYSQTTGSNVMTITIASHWLPAGGSAYLDFVAAGTGAAMEDGVYTAVTSTTTNDSTAGTTFTITAPDTTARSGFLRMVRFQGSYTVTDSGLVSPQNKRITLDTTSGGIADHHLNVGDHVYLNITGGNPKAMDGEFIIESVPDSNTFTVLTTGISNVGDNGIWMFPLVSQPLTRSGQVGAPPSTFLMNNTNGDFDQTPLASPTVFNFFLPDYKFSGALAARGMTTPEFQITTETNVVRQANFFYNGLFKPGNTNGISSFKSGTNALVMDLGAWMGNATDAGMGAGPQTGQPWTSNANLGTLIEKLQTLLLAGQLPSAAKISIQNFLYRTISTVNTGSPCLISSPGHGLLTGDSITISGVTGSTPSINATFVVTRMSDDTFTIPVNCTTAPSASGLAAAHFSFVSYNNATPTDSQKRDRLRAIVHFIL